MTSSRGQAGDAVGGAADAYLPPSTTWAWRRVRITPAAGGHSDSGPKGRRWRGRVAWNRREPITLRVSYRGGSQAWVEIHARGDFSRYPGDTAIIDVMRDIWRDE